MEINSGVEKLTKNLFLNLFLLFLFNTFVYITVFGAVLDVAPPRLDWVRKFAIGFCVLAGLITSIISTSKTKEIVSIPEWFKVSTIPLVLGLACMLALYFVSLIAYPDQYVEKRELDEALVSKGLNEKELATVLAMIQSQGYVTAAEVDAMPLSEEKKKWVLSILQEFGFVTENRVIDIIATQDAVKAAQAAMATQQAKVTTCFIELEITYNSATIRDQPSLNGLPLGYLAKGEQLRSIGHNGGKININRWWLVDINHGAEIVSGWISSTVVNEINEIECLKLPLAVGSSVVKP